MHIKLTSDELENLIYDYVSSFGINLDDKDVSINFSDEGAEVSLTDLDTPEKPKKRKRRTKAEIEADKKAEEVEKQDEPDPADEGESELAEQDSISDIVDAVSEPKKETSSIFD